MAVDAPAVAHQYEPDVAWDGSQYLVVWEDHRAIYPDVYGRWVDPAGVPTGSAFAIASTGNDEEEPQVACDGAGACLVIWHEPDNAVVGARVAASGVGPAVQIAGWSRDADVTFDGTDWVVAVAEVSGHVSYARVSADASSVAGPYLLLDTTSPILPSCTGMLSFPEAAATSGGGVVLVPYVSQCLGVGRDQYVGWAVVSPGGDMVTPTAILVDDRPGADSFNRWIDVDASFDGTHFLVGALLRVGITWELGAWQVNTSGAIVHTYLVDSPMQMDGLALAFDGTEHTAATRGMWSETDECMLARRLGPAAPFAIGPEMSIAPVVGPETCWNHTSHTYRHPAIASDGAGQTIVAYTRWELGVFEHVRIQTVPRIGLTGDPCASDAGCASGTCHHGACCDVTCADCELCEGGTTCIPVAMLETVLCRAAAGPCDRAENCVFGSTACPTDVYVFDGTVCDDGDPSTGPDTCVAGVCGGVFPAPDAGIDAGGMAPDDAAGIDAPGLSPDAAPAPGPEDDGGCSCSIGGRRGAGTTTTLAVVATLLSLAWRPLGRRGQSLLAPRRLGPGLHRLRP